jgi:hypothetical protein
LLQVCGLCQARAQRRRGAGDIYCSDRWLLIIYVPVWLHGVAGTDLRSDSFYSMMYRVLFRIQLILARSRRASSYRLCSHCVPFLASSPLVPHPIWFHAPTTSFVLIGLLGLFFVSNFLDLRVQFYSVIICQILGLVIACLLQLSDADLPFLFENSAACLVLSV